MYHSNHISSYSLFCLREFKVELFHSAKSNLKAHFKFADLLKGSLKTPHFIIMKDVSLYIHVSMCSLSRISRQNYNLRFILNKCTNQSQQVIEDSDDRQYNTTRYNTSMPDELNYLFGQNTPPMNAKRRISSLNDEELEWIYQVCLQKQFIRPP